MKKVGVVLVVALLLIPALAGPADAWSRGGGFHHGGGGHGGRFGGGFFFGLGVGALLTAPFWCCPSSYAYPAYGPAYTYPAYPYPAYPAYSYPAYGTAEAYAYPTYAPPPPAPSATSPTPEPLSPAPAPQASTQNCQTVQVEGHYETRVLQSGQRVTAWIPAYSQQVCQ